MEDPSPRAAAHRAGDLDERSPAIPRARGVRAGAPVRGPRTIAELRQPASAMMAIGDLPTETRSLTAVRRARSAPQQFMQRAHQACPSVRSRATKPPRTPTTSSPPPPPVLLANAAARATAGGSHRAESAAATGQHLFLSQRGRARRATAVRSAGAARGTANVPRTPRPHLSTGNRALNITGPSAPSNRKNETWGVVCETRSRSDLRHRPLDRCDRGPAAEPSSLSCREPLLGVPVPPQQPPDSRALGADNRAPRGPIRHPPVDHLGNERRPRSRSSAAPTSGLP